MVYHNYANFSDLTDVLMYSYFHNYYYWEFIPGKYDNLEWFFYEDVNWYISFDDNLSIEDDHESSFEDSSINYWFDGDSRCSTPYSIIDYGKYFRNKFHSYNT